jgi:hypothetical protein
MFRVMYEKIINYGDYSSSGYGSLKSGFKTYEEALAHIKWAKEHLIHDNYEIVQYQGDGT